MSDAVARPLVELDNNGSPAVLGYNVPEPTFYSGKSYINLLHFDAARVDPLSAAAPGGPGSEGDFIFRARTP
jgi:hypothetical protein